MSTRLSVRPDTATRRRTLARRIAHARYETRCILRRLSLTGHARYPVEPPPPTRRTL